MENIQNKSFKSFHLINNKVLIFFQGFLFESLSWGKSLLVSNFPIFIFLYFICWKSKKLKDTEFSANSIFVPTKKWFSPLYSSKEALQSKIVTFSFSLNQFFSNHQQSLPEGLVFLEAPSQILAFVFLETFSL